MLRIVHGAVLWARKKMLKQSNNSKRKKLTADQAHAAKECGARRKRSNNKKREGEDGVTGIRVSAGSRDDESIPEKRFYYAKGKLS